MHVVALVNAASTGVGMELQRALDKPLMGMNETPILCLIHQDQLQKLSFMVRGVDPEESAVFHLHEYLTLHQAKQHIFDFLSVRK